MTPIRHKLVAQACAPAPAPAPAVATGAALNLLLAVGLAEFLQEMRFVDLEACAEFARRGQYPNIADLVASSAELSLRPGALCFGWSAAARAHPRSGEASLALDMELRHGSVTAFFRLWLAEAGAEAEFICLEGDDGENPCEALGRVLRAARRGAIE